jgi:hypothetical protein
MRQSKRPARPALVAIIVALTALLSQLASVHADLNTQAVHSGKITRQEASIVVTADNDVLDAAGGVCESVTVASLPGPDGVTSLREAMCAANSNSGSDAISFNIPGTGVHTVNLLSQLPVSTGPVTIDGYTQPGASCNTLSNATNAALKIVLVGNNVSNASGIVILGGNSLVKGLVLQNFASAILLQSTGNTIAGNFIGTDAAGTVAAPNVNGIRIITANNAVGGGVPCDRNLISGNQAGIYLDTSAANNNSLVNNLIGTNAAGTGALPNTSKGVLIFGASNNTVGGVGGSSANVIAYNQDANVVVDDGTGTATGNRIRANSIYGSAGLGIDLNDDGVTANDANDPDSGPNSLQNFPEITIISGGTIGGRLNSTIGTSFSIELFASPTCDPSGHGEGQMYLGFVSVTTNSSGNGSFSFTGTPPSGWFVTATATNLGDNSTSEFSPCFPEAQATPTTVPTSTQIPNSGVISGRAYLHELTPGQEAVGALVYVCNTSTSYCSPAAATNDQGDYQVSSLPPGTYNVTAYPPSGYSLLNDRLTGIVINNNTVPGQDVVFRDPEPPDPDTGIVPDVGNDNIPVVHWDEELTLTTSGCEGGSATYEIRKGGLLLRSGPMVENPAGIFTAIIAPLYPETGDIVISINITCPDGSNEVEDFNVYIDPSGVVQSFLPNGTAAALPFATVTLYRSDAPAGPFVVVPNGSAQMSPSNRKNPDTTRREGRFGWDVIPGYYKVRAAKAGCIKPGDPTQPYVDTHIMEIPPPVFDLVLQLDCGSPSFTDVRTSDYFYNTVTYLAAIGVLSGYSGGAQCPTGVPCFLPYNNVTRGQTAKIVANAAGLTDDISNTQQTFQDVGPTTNSFWLFIERMAGRGYIVGYPCGGAGEPCGSSNKPYFRWGNNVTRNQLAKILVLTNQYATIYPADPHFQDVLATDTFYPYVETAYQKNMIAGYPCGGSGEPCGTGNKPYFRGSANATRGQLSKMVTQTLTAPGP